MDGHEARTSPSSEFHFAKKKKKKKKHNFYENSEHFSIMFSVQALKVIIIAA